jgi:hypothetical protein
MLCALIDIAIITGQRIGDLLDLVCDQASRDRRQRGAPSAVI